MQTLTILETDEFKFIAKWDEIMMCEDGDYLACPVKDKEWVTPTEVYRIEKDIFSITYTEVKTIETT